LGQDAAAEVLPLVIENSGGATVRMPEKLATPTLTDLDEAAGLKEVG
jgi:hypothetical protein